VPEDPVLVDDLRRDLLRAADEVGAARSAARFEGLALIGGQPRSRPIRSIIAANGG